MKKYQIIEITWLDSLHSSGWRKEKWVPLTTLEDMTHKTIGYFLKENKRSIIVIQSYREFENYVLGIMEIPKGSILEIKKLKIK